MTWSKKRHEEAEGVGINCSEYERDLLDFTRRLVEAELNHLDDWGATTPSDIQALLAEWEGEE